MTIPFSYIVMWVTIFGNSAVKQIRDGDAVFGEAAVNTPELGFFTLLQQYPLALVVVALATFVGLLFYVTSADSGALVMANLSSELPDGEQDAAPALRILWSVATGVLTIAMLLVGGIPALQSATIIMGLPFAFVIVAVMVGLHRALESERAREGAAQATLASSLLGRESSGIPWRLRLARTFGTVSVEQARERFDDVVVPALHAVREALGEREVESEVVVSEVDTGARVVQTAALVVAAETGDFRYPVQIRRAPAPSFGTRRLDSRDLTTRLEVAQHGAGGYDLMGYDGEDVCHDVLDHYERWAASSALVAGDPR